MRLNSEQEIIKFDGKNYHEWAAATKFMSKELWQQVIDKQFEKKESETELSFKERISMLSSDIKVAVNKALGIIGRTVKSDYLEQISRSKTAYQAWGTLKQIYEGDKVSNLMTIRSEFIR